MDVVGNFWDLFAGRPDAYGDWNGGCVRSEVTYDRIKEHLHGSTPIGIYPHFNRAPDWRPPDATICRWGCTDIDKTDDPAQAIAIRDALAAMNVTAWIERTAHGWHVWVFATDWLAASFMRRMFLAAHQVAGVPAKEVNPKQEVLADGEVGNYVRLPYPNGWGNVGEPLNRYVYDDEILSLDLFVAAAMRCRTPIAKIIELANYYNPPATPQRIIAAPTQDMTEAARKLSPVGKMIFRDGPLEGRDRSTTLYRFVAECHKAGLAPEDCRVLLEDADLRWGKFMERGPKGEQELEKMIGRLYGFTP